MISINLATIEGGGIKLAALAVAYGSSSVNNNSAIDGGGIAAHASDQGRGVVNLYTTDPSRPVAMDSLGVDYTPGVDDYDLDGNPRPVDLIAVPDASGPTDVGAYEIQTQPMGVCLASDTIFCNGFDG